MDTFLEEALFVEDGDCVEEEQDGHQQVCEPRHGL
jgi:hypothetical protein